MAARGDRPAIIDRSGSDCLTWVQLARRGVEVFEIERGGELRFTMSATPNKAWGTAIASRPYSMSGY